MFWLAGGLGGASWDRIVIPAVPLAVGSVYLMSHARELNALLIGEETATSLGVSPERFRRVLFVVAALLTGASVALAGGIGFVGLVVPHAARLILGPDHARLLPTACLGGGLFLLWADVLARIIVQPQELPIGVITALVGTPLFGLLLARHSGLGHAREREGCSGNASDPGRRAASSASSSRGSSARRSSARTVARSHEDGRSASRSTACSSVGSTMGAADRISASRAA